MGNCSKEFEIIFLPSSMLIVIVGRTGKSSEFLIVPITVYWPLASKKDVNSFSGIQTPECFEGSFEFHTSAFTEEENVKSVRKMPRAMKIT